VFCSAGDRARSSLVDQLLDLTQNVEPIPLAVHSELVDRNARDRDRSVHKHGNARDDLFCRLAGEGLAAERLVELARVDLGATRRCADQSINELERGRGPRVRR
jgi:hypothetical protein